MHKRWFIVYSWNIHNARYHNVIDCFFSMFYVVSDYFPFTYSVATTTMMGYITVGI